VPSISAMDASFAIHIDCDNLWIYETEFAVPISDRQDLIFLQALPNLLDRFSRWGIKATFFVVGCDLQRQSCVTFCKRALFEGHRIANHTLSHRVDFSRLNEREKLHEIEAGHAAIVAATGTAPVGFRAPGYHVDAVIIRSLARLGYQYDSSVLPGPAGYLIKAHMLARGQGAKGKSFGSWKSLFATSSPRRLAVSGHRTLMQYPVATFPYARLPIHSTFIYSFGLEYLRKAISLLSRTPGHHIYLLHAVDGLDHPAPEEFGGRLVPLTKSFAQRMKILEEIGQLLSARVVLTEDVADTALKNGIIS
jgi:peptidoglycan/xylan/chitin deacetylase (PgdA/CDA1 family)